MENLLTSKVDTAELEQKVKKMYTDVALKPHGDYHFEMGRDLAEKLGYEPADLVKIPFEAIESFAGVGYYFDLAALKEGEKVLDLGSGSGMDTFIAALKVGESGKVVGVDMTDAQLEKAEQLRKDYNFHNVSFHKGYIEELDFEDNTFDAVISNGVINLSANKQNVFAEASRILKPGGRMVFADIITQSQLPENIVCNSSLWAACIGGASQRDFYQEIIQAAGLRVLTIKLNKEYTFLSKSAKRASDQYGVQSVSVYAEKVNTL